MFPSHVWIVLSFCSSWLSCFDIISSSRSSLCPTGVFLSRSFTVQQLLQNPHVLFFPSQMLCSTTLKRTHAGFMLIEWLPLTAETLWLRTSCLLLKIWKSYWEGASERIGGLQNPRLVSQSGPQFAYADLAFSLKVFRWQTGVWLSGLPINIPQLVGVWRGGRNRRVVGGKRVERG